MKLGEEEKMLDSLVGDDRYTKPYLLDYATDDTDEYHNTFFPSAYNFEGNTTDKLLTKEIYIAANSTVTLVLEIEFVDNEMVQNPLIDFGAVEGQVCTRMLICTTEEVNP